MRTILLAIITLLSFQAISQNSTFRCGQKEAYEALSKRKGITNPLSEKRKDPAGTSVNSDTTIYIIPVVFHVLHKYGSENISDAQIIDAVRVLNDDFRKRNADTTDIVPDFKTRASDTRIEFRLARRDPNGNCTSGINRIESNTTYRADDFCKDGTQWDPSKYLNIWTVATMGFDAAGYAYYPISANSWSQIDGIVILSNYVGAIGTSSIRTSRALTHEVGHYLNLSHVWGDNNDPGLVCDDDGVSDTPVTMGWRGCNLVKNDKCTSGVSENVQNYMEYAYCSNMFTDGQKTRMRDALNSNIAKRKNLWTVANHAFTGIDGSVVSACSPKASLNARKSVVCVNENVVISNFSSNANSYKWEAPGSDQLSSTSSSPTFTYGLPGIYPVSLVAKGPTGKDSTYCSDIITVIQKSPVQHFPYSEGFEAQPNLVYSNPHGDPVKWHKISTSAASGNSCYMLDLFNLSSTGTGNEDAFILPAFDFSKVKSVNLSFKAAYAENGNGNPNLKGSLGIYTSMNCGQNWVLRESFDVETLGAGKLTSIDYKPTAGDWNQFSSTALNNVIGQSEILVKFGFKNNGGNNLYIDDINIESYTLGTAELEKASGLKIVPNPVIGDQPSVIELSLSQSEKAELTIFDMQGKIQAVVFSGILSSGKHIFILPKQLNSGIYFLNYSSEINHKTSKMIINRSAE